MVFGMTMPKRNFGENGPAVGAVGFGAMSFGGFYGASDEATSHDALRACLETGTTHWDTANVYGPETSENYIGSFLAANPGVRDQIHLATKGSIWRNPETGVRGFTNDPDHLRSALEASLLRLGVDHVDLYYVHRRDPKFTIEEVMGTMMDFKAENSPGDSSRASGSGSERVLVVDAPSRIGRHPGLQRNRRRVCGLLTGRAWISYGKRYVYRFVLAARLPS
jgi:aryl-alcohol dehydrogenase-like predicted oxidoreductase